MTLKIISRSSNFATVKVSHRYIIASNIIEIEQNDLYDIAKTSFMKSLVLVIYM